MPSRNDLDQRHLAMAELVSRDSKDWIKVGAVLVRPDESVASVGCNGLPPGVDDAYWMRFREAKLHAEENALLHTRDGDLTGYAVYLWPTPPCLHCASQLRARGIRRVVAALDWRDIPRPRLKERCRSGLEMLAGIVETVPPCPALQPALAAWLAVAQEEGHACAR